MVLLEGVYFFLGLNHLPLITSPTNMNAIASQVKVVFSAENAITKRITPSMRKMLDGLSLF
jgi:hypothetical protein